MSTSAPRTVKDIIDFIDKLTAEDEADDEQSALEPFLKYIRVAREEWDDEFYETEQPRFRRLIDQKLFAEYPEDAARRITEAAIEAEFPELFKD